MCSERPRASPPRPTPCSPPGLARCPVVSIALSRENTTGLLAAALPKPCYQTRLKIILPLCSCPPSGTQTSPSAVGALHAPSASPFIAMAGPNSSQPVCNSPSQQTAVLLHQPRLPLTPSPPPLLLQSRPVLPATRSRRAKIKRNREFEKVVIWLARVAIVWTGESDKFYPVENHRAGVVCCRARRRARASRSKLTQDASAKWLLRRTPWTIATRGSCQRQREGAGGRRGFKCRFLAE